MKKSSSRRQFLKQVGTGGSATALLSAAPFLANVTPPKEIHEDETGGNASAETRLYNSRYAGAFLNRVAFPMGGLGAGMICLEGTGAFSHVSVRNKPEIFNEPGMFAAISVKGVKNGARLLEGPVPDWKKFGLKDAGNGLVGATTGLPRFRQCSFLARFPFGQIDLSDADLPLDVQVTGWSPFIPGDENNSGLPVAAVEYSFHNKGKQPVEAVFSFNTKNFLSIDKGANAVRPLENGFVLTETGSPAELFRSDFAVSTDDSATKVDHCWFRGGWWDPLTMAWNAVRDGLVKSVAPVEKDAPGASLYLPFNLAAGARRTIRLLFAWYTPDSAQSYGTMGTHKDPCDPASGCCNSPADIALDKYDKDFHGKTYKPWYSSRFANIEDVVKYWRGSYDELRKNSRLFTDAFYSSTLPPEVMEAVAANLTILKSPTVMRQYDGRLWSFEGCGDSWGCCHGSCTHVWNYAQAIPHLFPALERSLRHTEFCENQDSRGHQNFRATLPIGPNEHGFHSAADGQLGGIMKAYREWRIGGSKEWLLRMYPMIQKSMDYCIQTWDPRHNGVIEEPHHNTYDIEFWGPDGMHGSFYLGALMAITSMGSYLQKDVSVYKELAAKAKQSLEKDLFNGEYFVQQIKVAGLSAKNPATELSFGGEYSEEARQLLQKEGPKYQYGTGCLSDGILGAWIARMCGLNDIVDARSIKSHLAAVHQYNLKMDLSEHANPQRPAYALGNEAGLLLCTWPRGGQLSLPFVYSDEVWTGIEHQVASHLMLMGEVQKGLDIVRASRNRYDGRVRNPFNEYECGHWYARALSSYGYLQALTGLRYDAVDQTLYIDSKVGDFNCFLSTETGFGTVRYKGGKATLHTSYGTIDVKKTVIHHTSRTA